MLRRAEIAPSLIAALVAFTVFAGVADRAAGDPIPLSPIAQTSGATLSASYGIEFVTVDVHNNPAWQGDGTPGDRAIGRGSVAEPFRIGRYEVTTAQWTQFYNAAAYVGATQGVIPFIQLPTTWGAVSSANPYGAGLGWSVPAGNEMRFVGGISWRTAAIYCNWLCNNQALTRDAFMNGAYDVSTFGYVNGSVFTDQPAHTPGAAYYIPTWDQYLAAVHYDPNRYGPGQPGYWRYPNARNTPTPGGPPGIGEANWGIDGPTNILLGAYQNTQSPWGILDSAGGTMEWLETIYDDGVGRVRYLDGSSYRSGSSSIDWIGYDAGDYPSFPLNDYGFRLAASVPAPVTCYLCVLAGLMASRRVRPHNTH